MAIDIYTGPFTRYFSGQWENEVQQRMHEEGKEYQIVKPNSESNADDLLYQREISTITESWLNELEKLLDTPLALNEGGSIPYFTSRFNEYTNLYEASCYVMYPEIDLNLFAQDSEFIKNTEKNYDFLFFRDVETWLPIILPKSQTLEVLFPNGAPKIISSTNCLIKELEKMAKIILNKTLSELEENYITLNEKELYWINNTGLLKFYNHAKYSLKHNVPIILDY